DDAPESHRRPSLREGASPHLRCARRTQAGPALPGVCNFHGREGCNAAAEDRPSAGGVQGFGSPLFSCHGQTRGVVRAATEGRRRSRDLPPEAGGDGPRPVGISNAAFLRDWLLAAYIAPSQSPLLAHWPAASGSREVPHLQPRDWVEGVSRALARDVARRTGGVLHSKGCGTSSRSQSDPGEASPMQTIMHTRTSRLRSNQAVCDAGQLSAPDSTGAASSTGIATLAPAFGQALPSLADVP